MSFFCDTTAGELKPPAGKFEWLYSYKQAQIHFFVDYTTATCKIDKKKKRQEVTFEKRAS